MRRLTVVDLGASVSAHAGCRSGPSETAALRPGGVLGGRKDGQRESCKGEGVLHFLRLREGETGDNE